MLSKYMYPMLLHFIYKSTGIISENIYSVDSLSNIDNLEKEAFTQNILCEYTCVVEYFVLQTSLKATSKKMRPKLLFEKSNIFFQKKVQLF